MSWLNSLSSASNTGSASAWSADALLFDVRTPAEFEQGHVQGAVNLPLDQFTQHYAALMPNRDHQIIVYCRSGARSGMAAQFLQQQQFTQVINGGSVHETAQKSGRQIV